MKILNLIFLICVITNSSRTQWYQQNSGTNEGFYGVDFSDSLNGAAVGGNGIIIRTTDGGNNWATQTSGTGDDLLGVSFTDANNGIAVGINGAILRTTNGGQNWTQQVSGTGFTILGIQMLDANIAIAVGYFGTILKTIDGGENWIPKTSGTTKHIYGVSFVDMNNGIASGGTTDGGIIIKTTDGGETWVTKLTGIPEILYGISAVDTNKATAVGGFFDISFRTKIILRTNNGGENWETQLFETTNPLRGVFCTDSSNGTSVGTDGEIFRTTDGGLSWSNQPSTTVNSLIAVSFTDAYNGWAVGWFGTVLHTNNGGTPVELISFNVDYIEREKAVELSWSTATETNNSGFEILRSVKENVWEHIGFVPGYGTTTETQHYTFTDININSGKYLYKLKQIDYDGTFEYSQIVEVKIPLVNEFALEQNYPNPFNPTTKIKYQLPMDGMVTLKVYDILGAEIATLVEEEKTAGRYEVNFDASKLASGVYIYRLQANDFISVKKMMLLK